MKIKRALSAFLALCIVIGAMPAFAFSDISEPNQSNAAESLRSLGIVADVANFNPNNNLSRAEFCKMAVLAAGFNELSVYSSYTLYPDVPSWQWYAPYINAAIGKYKMIQGYPNGLFGPNDTITYGQATTILLRLLGYETKDIGAFWPNDYVKKAQDIGLANGLTGLSANAAIPRGQAAILLRNLLGSVTKDGSAFISTGFSAGKVSVLCASDKTDPALDRGKLRFCDITGTVKDIVTNPGTISDDLIGVRGTMVYSKTDSSKLVGFISDSRAPQKATVKTTTAEYIETENGKITIPRTAKAFVYGEINDYTVCWYDIKAGSDVYIYTDAQGNIDFVSARQSSGITDTFIYGVDNVAIPANAMLELNGSKITVAQLQKYDVVSYVPQENIYRVSDTRLSVTFESSGPTYNNPTYIVASGQTYAISESAAKYFKDLGFNKVITLVFDVSGNVAAAFAQSEISSTTLGILTDLGSPSAPKATIDPINGGKQIVGEPDFAGYTQSVINQEFVSSLFEQEGKLVVVLPTTDGKLKITPVTFNTSLAGKYDKSTSRLGNYDVSTQVKLYERPAPGMPLRKISLSDLPATMPASRVLHAQLDRSGKIGLLILDNITGDGFNYGLLKQTSERVAVDSGLNGDTSYRTEYTLTLRTSKGTTTTNSFYSASGISFDVIAGAVATGVDTLAVKTSTPGSALKSSGNVERDCFDTARGVRIGNIYVPVSADVQVYNKALDRFLTLSEARANFKTFELFCDSDPLSGGKVRVIIAK